jgi:hypothetical protein
MLELVEDMIDYSCSSKATAKYCFEVSTSRVRTHLGARGT